MIQHESVEFEIEEPFHIESPFEQAYEGAAGFDAIYRFLTARGFRYEGALGQLNSRKTGRVRQEDSVYVRG